MRSLLRIVLLLLPLGTLAFLKVERFCLENIRASFQNGEGQTEVSIPYSDDIFSASFVGNDEDDFTESITRFFPLIIAGSFICLLAGFSPRIPAALPQRIFSHFNSPNFLRVFRT